MQLKTFTLPAAGNSLVEEELNKFLRSHRVLQLERHFCAEGGGFWALLIEYMEGDPQAEAPPSQRREKKDFVEGLSENEKLRYETYKTVRRELAQQYALPAYLIFTNEELATLSRLPELNDETVKGIKGIAPQRLKDYIRFFYTKVTYGQESGQPNAKDSEP